MLPIRTAEKKLVFPLCRTCAEEQQLDPCRHDDDQRTLAGTWTHVELIKAVELGYRVRSVSEVWHWDQWTDGLFSPYVKRFYTVKEEASGWPDWVKTPQDREQHLQQVLQRDGVELDPAQVRSNPGLRQTAKIMLNSFWGEESVWFELILDIFAVFLYLISLLFRCR